MTSSVLRSPSVERVRTALAGAGLVAEIVELPGAARTAKAAADFLGCEVAQIANSLVFRGDPSGMPILVMSSGARRVDTARLGAIVGESIGKADADYVRLHTGFAIGGVAPVGHEKAPVMLVDRELFRFDCIWAAAGHPHGVFKLAPSELAALTGAPVEDVTA